MSKHPIPDWLRSQFSLIEDEVRKLGPCGVFTQMRTVTQTYFERQAAAPQPPALGGGPINRYDTGWTFGRADLDVGGAWVKFEDHRAHVAAQQAEIERTNARLHEVAVLCASVEQERDQLKARNAELEGWLSLSAQEIRSLARSLMNACEDFDEEDDDYPASDECADAEKLAGRIDAALNPAKGSNDEAGGETV
ncbi:MULTISPECIES: hypothetical protein [Pseudomonas syringae group]|uniref:hypothetical protein n=1 Tax=Pseudomonas syringae group TaxID=136849 RepID=UPI001068294C|nr:MULTISPECIES: hypothetical protein [Pseudomonas syringae group]MBM1212137.1 hypothetical protein [Pseudomonas syringae]MBM1218000.1 hypothetical protein [Pseudomonas syringae]MBX6404130.1 hypothetical protein [Pseudomonas syringae pv. tomato]MBX6411763.1 hypothetical protein [Pseudomonas syringae pv. tomato]MBX6432146.1 hypothetical protein [Pseudomonas syringae pv. tomato]